MSSYYIYFKMCARHDARKSLKKLAGDVLTEWAEFVKIDSVVDSKDVRLRWTTISFALPSSTVNVFKAIEDMVATLRKNGVQGSVDVLEGSTFRV